MNFLKSINQATGPVTRLEEIADILGPDAVVRAISAGLDVYDTGAVLMADASAAELLAKASIQARTDSVAL
jgi:hypothetical protein